MTTGPFTLMPTFERLRKRDAPRVLPRVLPDPQPSMAVRFGQALSLLEAGHWPQAFEELSALAHRGHPSAARIALMMASRGGPLFGGHFRATAQDIARWQEVAA